MEIDTTLDYDLLTVFKKQLLLGWENTLHGFLSHKLESCQQNYYTKIGSRRLFTRWGIQLIIKLWTIVQHHWIYRYNILRKSNLFNILSGREHLEEAVLFD